MMRKAEEKARIKWAKQAQKQEELAKIILAYKLTLLWLYLQDCMLDHQVLHLLPDC